MREDKGEKASLDFTYTHASTDDDVMDLAYKKEFIISLSIACMEKNFPGRKHILSRALLADDKRGKSTIGEHNDIILKWGLEFCKNLSYLF